MLFAWSLCARFLILSSSVLRIPPRSVLRLKISNLYEDLLLLLLLLPLVIVYVTFTTLRRRDLSCCLSEWYPGSASQRRQVSRQACQVS